MNNKFFDRKGIISVYLMRDVVTALKKKAHKSQMSLSHYAGEILMKDLKNG